MSAPVQTEGDSKRKLSERKDPGASAGCSIEQGFPADAIHYHRRGPANGQPAKTPLDEALASASIPQSRRQDTRTHDRVDQARSRANPAGRGQSMAPAPPGGRTRHPQ